jgi:hypothetical protein
VSCKSPKTITQKFRDRTTIQYLTKRDSIYLRDTVRIEKKNDTIYYTEKIYKDKFLLDTVIVRDTINNNTVETKVQKEIVKKVDWRKTLLYSLIGAGIIIGIGVFIRFIRKTKII